MSRGPVQYFVLTFPGNPFKGEIDRSAVVAGTATTISRGVSNAATANLLTGS